MAAIISSRFIVSPFNFQFLLLIFLALIFLALIFLFRFFANFCSDFLDFDFGLFWLKANGQWLMAWLQQKSHLFSGGFLVFDFGFVFTKG
jgi:hypothetical protein